MRATIARSPLFAIALLQNAGAHAMDIAGHAGGPWTLQVRSIKEARLAGIVRQQHDFSCGAAAVATLLTYHWSATPP